MNISLRSVALLSFFALAACASKSSGDNVDSSTAHVETGAPKADEGDFCDETATDPCADGLVCTAPGKGMSTGSTCEKIPGDEGDFCDESAKCGDGLVCTPPTGGMSTGSTCETAPGDEGDYCDSTATNPCLAGLSCKPAPKTSSFTGTLCTK